MIGRTTAPLAALVVCLSLAGAALPDGALAKPIHKAAHKAKPAAKPKAPEPPQTVRQLADWIVSSGDNRDMPFAVVDKKAAVVAVFDATGKMLGLDVALVGSAEGDDSAPGVGDRELSDIPMDERTTPAGRFIGGYGAAAGQRKVLWIDYGTAISMHPVITTNPAEKRPERLKSKTPDDNRITHGCINVPARFYSKVVSPAFKDGPGLFYILPDTKPLFEVFPDFYVQTLLATRASAAQTEPPRPSEPS
jgi:hypothetical protein